MGIFLRIAAIFVLFSVAGSMAAEADAQKKLAIIMAHAFEEYVDIRPIILSALKPARTESHDFIRYALLCADAAHSDAFYTAAVSQKDADDSVRQAHAAAREWRATMQKFAQQNASFHKRTRSTREIMVRVPPGIIGALLAGFVKTPRPYQPWKPTLKEQLQDFVRDLQHVQYADVQEEVHEKVKIAREHARELEELCAHVEGELQKLRLRLEPDTLSAEETGDGGAEIILGNGQRVRDDRAYSRYGDINPQQIMQ